MHVLMDKTQQAQAGRDCHESLEGLEAGNGARDAGRDIGG